MHHSWEVERGETHQKDPSVGGEGAGVGLIQLSALGPVLDKVAQLKKPAVDTRVLGDHVGVVQRQGVVDTNVTGKFAVGSEFEESVQGHLA